MAKFCYLMTGIIIIPLWCASCNDNNPRKEIQKIVKEWIGKTVLLPQDIQPTSYSCNTVYDPAKSKKPFRILNFTDSIGCTSCKLKLLTWNAYVREIDTTLADKVDFLFYFHPQNERELGLILRADGFELPFYIDRKNEIDRLNGFPKNQACQCFLLDSTNKILLVGNPTHKPRLWELYKEIISGKKADKVPTTDIRIARPEIEVPDLRIGSTAQAAFVLENTGNKPLVITHIDASCGCTKPSWNRSPVMPGEKSEIKVEIIPDKAGAFDKTLRVFCNTSAGSTSLKIIGMVEE